MSVSSKGNGQWNPEDVLNVGHPKAVSLAGDKKGGGGFRLENE